ncbi:hypothetical protein F8M41_023228 [Gigaspora margarita]|uniref:Uncharacterized protein n=1 Tax=Gigaspora margarita TaxID=4874 RepID=A0A8H4ADQ6_GIGMA|nr:hypothetical protein F8M41_023228 [Gigaspora margarita]
MKAIKFAHVRSVVKVNERQLLRVDPLVLYHGLPGHLRSSNRKTHGIDMELWLVEGQECLIIPEDVTQINVWLKDLDRPVEYEYFVTEILYSFNSWWHIHDLIKRHRAPYEYIPIPPLPPRQMPIKKIFFDIYYDNFGTFRNAYHSLDGVYLQKTDSACRQFASQYGLSKKPVFDKLYWNRHLQIPQDAYHALASKAAHLLDITLRYLNTNGKVAWLKDTLRLAILILFILHYFLLPSYFKIEIIEHLKNIYQLARNDHAIIKLIELWVVEAKLLKLAFSTTMTSNTYKELRSLFEKE